MAKDIPPVVKPNTVTTSTRGLEGHAKPVVVPKPNTTNTSTKGGK